jgi:CO dehydrogenase maturation factor
MCEGHPHHEHEHSHEPAERGFQAATRALRELSPRQSPDELRIVITGKGGVGKTSVTALLARLLARDGFDVLALDADPQMNLPWALGFPREEARKLIPLSHDLDYVEEMTGARPGEGWGLFFRLNPDVRDVVRRFGVVGPDGVRLLVMGDVVQPAAGCLCPENALLAAVMGAMSLRRNEIILLDTQAGVEHFGRALAKGFRHCVVLTDPTFNGVQVALQTAHLAREIGIPRIHLVVNRVRSVEEWMRTLARLDEDGSFPFTAVHALPWEEALLEHEPSIGPLLEEPHTPFLNAVGVLRDALVLEAGEVDGAGLPPVGLGSNTPAREETQPCVS